eukprot:GHUV01042917.1.p1 GENE.GHUV01042917.1~~GHUV01042917.1.p1  ORF type:complete len:119 (+),score=12.56 GHUV01042917.1:161-517(+)
MAPVEYMLHSGAVALAAPDRSQQPDTDNCSGTNLLCDEAIQCLLMLGPSLNTPICQHGVMTSDWLQETPMATYGIAKPSMPSPSISLLFTLASCFLSSWLSTSELTWMVMLSPTFFVR